VSLYNETDGVGIPPTPVVGGIGLIDDLDRIATLKGAKSGDVLVLTGDTKGHLGASAYARVILGLEGLAAGSAPRVDLTGEKDRGTFVRAMIAAGHANAVHDVSEGGIACAAAEMALASGIGVKLQYDYDWKADGCANEGALLFGEDSGRYLFAMSSAQFQDYFDNWPKDKPQGRLRVVGHFTDAQDAAISYAGDTAQMSVSLSALRAAHEGWLPAYMKG
jgi:phosphoribosylformylglycinamidine synthase